MFLSFVKKPIQIQAVRWYPDARLGEWVLGQFVRYQPGKDEYGVEYEPHGCGIPTLEGYMLIQPGDWLVRGLAGELYPCKDHIFRRSYDGMDDAAREALAKQ